jgi:hypothetical protein
MTGVTDPAPSGPRGHAHNHEFTFFHTGDGFQFHFAGFGHAQQQRRDTITTYYFQNTVLRESSGRMWLLYFFGDFCMPCEEVSRLWDELKEEMESLGIGMASVHRSQHYSIARHCSVERVPDIVAVLNRRVFRYHGPTQTRSVRNFVKSTLPSMAELTAQEVDSFIADAINRNKPRVILFSPHPQPSLLYKALAFSNQLVADFGFVTTDKQNLSKFGVSQKSNKLLVFKEYPLPSASIEGDELTKDTLRSVLRGLSLHLPRLSSPHIMDTTCGTEGRLCLILVVPGVWVYNDSITGAFRAQAAKLSAREGGGTGFAMAYIDQDKQKQFLGSFERSGADSGKCENGQTARNVLLLRIKTGFHPLYGWFDDYCGSSEDFKRLLSFAAKTSLKPATGLPDLLDEFAPGVLARIRDRVVEICNQVYDHFSISQMPSLLIVTSVMAAILCCRGVSQTPGIPTLNSQLYDQHVKKAPEGSTVILQLTNSMKDISLLSCLAERYNEEHRFCFFKGRLDKKKWLKNLLKGGGMDEEEITKRFYSSGKRMCVLALFGAEKQFAIFDDFLTISSGSLPNGMGEEQEKTQPETVPVLDSLRFEDGEPFSRERVTEEKLKQWIEQLEHESLAKYSTDHWPSWK